MKKILSLLARVAVTGFAFWWIFRMVDKTALRNTLSTVNVAWLLTAILCSFTAQFGCIARWRLLVPVHPSLTWPFLINSFFVGTFFNTFLPTTVGGDVVRSYDLIKATGQWREPLASILLDRLIGLVSLAGLAFIAWLAFPPAREDPLLRMAFLGFCLLVFVTFGVLGSRRVLQASLKPFGRIGLGQLQSHAKQFQETLLSYFRQPKTLVKAFGVSIGIQAIAILMYISVARALHSTVPVVFLILIVPIVVTVSQLPISLNGWGIREGATILFFERIGIGSAEALSFSLIMATMPLLSGLVGGILFMTRKKHRK